MFVEMFITTALLVPGIIGLAVAASVALYAQDAKNRAAGLLIAALFFVHILLCFFWY